MAVNLVVFVSGNGTNLEQIIKHFSNSEKVKVAMVLSNKPNAFALMRAARYDIPTEVLKKSELNDQDIILPLLKKYNTDFIVLAGFLLMVPHFVIDAYPKRIINLHPALLPKFGGKGMYGHHVHEAVKAAGEKQTGFTVHYVSSVCDGGEIIEQRSINIMPDDTAEDIAFKENQLELKEFPSIIEMIISKTFEGAI